MSDADETLIDWPNMSAYGLTINYVTLPSGRTVVVARGAMPNARVVSDEHAGKLDRLGFVRHKTGIYFSHARKPNVTGLLSEFPNTVVEKRRLDDITIDMSAPGVESESPPAP